MATRTHLTDIRGRRGITASQLAKLTGVSRQTIYAIEAGNYVPNTALALQLARILEVQVEDLFQLEDEPGQPAPSLMVDLLPSAVSAHAGQPVQVCRVGRRTVGIPAAAQTVMLPVSDGIVSQTLDQGRKAEVRIFEEGFEKEKRVLVAGCDPGISVLGQHLARVANVDLIVAASGSQRALEWLKEGKVHVAGSHLLDTPSGEYNVPIVRRFFPKGEASVVTFAIWEQGLLFESGNPKRIRGVSDLARNDVTIVNREKGAGSRELLYAKLREAGIPSAKVKGYDRIAYGHLPAASAVSMREADCCVATRSAARAFGLGFLPLATERYDLVLRRQHLHIPAIEALLEALNRSAVRRQLESLAGYDTAHTGEVLLS